MSEKLNRVQLFSYEDMMYRKFERTLGHYHEAHHTMAPQDIWREATSLYKQLEKSGNPYDRITLMKEQTEKDFRPNDRFLILLSLMHLLYMTLPGQDEGGMVRIVCHLAEAVYFHPWREEVMCSIWPEGCLQETDNGMVCDSQDVIQAMNDFAISVLKRSDDNTIRAFKYQLFEHNMEVNNMYDPVIKMMSEMQMERNYRQMDMPQDVQKQEVSVKIQKKDTPDDVADVLQELMEATDDEGRQLFTMKSQWIAVYRIFVDYLGWKNEYRDFCRQINYMGEYPIPCLESAVKRIDGIFAKPFKTWSKKLYKGQSKVYYRQYEVAKWLVEHLGL